MVRHSLRALLDVSHVHNLHQRAACDAPCTAGRFGVVGLHHVAWYLSTEGLRDQSEPERSRYRLTERLDLLRQNLNQLLKLLQLRGHDLKQLLQIQQLLLLERLYLL
jgi:hypothetical protein